MELNSIERGAVPAEVQRDRVVTAVFARLDLLLLGGITLTLPFAELWLIIPALVLLHGLYPLLLLGRLPKAAEARLRSSLPVPQRTLFRTYTGHHLLTRSYVVFSVILIPRGRLDDLEKPEMKAQIAHEFSHCQRQDWFLMTVAQWVLVSHIMIGLGALALVAVDTAFPGVREVLNNQPGAVPIEGSLGGAPIYFAVFFWMILLLSAFGVVIGAIHRREFIADTQAMRIVADGTLSFLSEAARRERFSKSKDEDASNWNAAIHPTFADRLKLQTTGGIYTRRRMVLAAMLVGFFFTAFLQPAIIAGGVTVVRAVLGGIFACAGLALVAAGFQQFRREVPSDSSWITLWMAAGFWLGVIGSWTIVLILLVLFAEFVFLGWVRPLLFLAGALALWLILCWLSLQIRRLREMSGLFFGLWWALLGSAVFLLGSHVYAVGFESEPVAWRAILETSLYLAVVTFAAFGADFGLKRWAASAFR